MLTFIIILITLYQFNVNGVLLNNSLLETYKLIKKMPEKYVYDNVAAESFRFDKSSLNEYSIFVQPPVSIGKPFPRPTNVIYFKQFIRISNDVNFLFKKENCDIINKGILRYHERIFVNKFISTIEKRKLFHADSEKNTIDKPKEINLIRIEVGKCSAKDFPNEAMDESYKIKIKDNSIKLEAHESWGILRGLETLAQIIFLVQSKNSYLFYIQNVAISDNPTFLHRGVMIDTARHYIPMKQLKQNLQALEMNKMNVFHWHLTDDQSFPFVSRSHPELSLKGAFHANKVYNETFIREIVDFARFRGIRVIPEIDIPGHTYSWHHSHPELFSRCYDAFGKPDGFIGPINPIILRTFDLIFDVFSDLTQLFPDNHIHMGIDEVGMGCWYNDPTILEYLKKHNTSNIRNILAIFINKFQKTFKSKFPKKKIIMWQDILDSESITLLHDTTLQVWRTKMPDASHYMNSGFPVIYSTDYYLDKIQYGAVWTRYYTNLFGIDKPPSALIGAEACMWNEFQSEHTILQTIWPTTSALAEIYWSGYDNDMLVVAARLEELRCRLIRNGIPVGVASGPGDCNIIIPPEHYSRPIEMDNKKIQIIETEDSGILTIFMFCLGFLSGLIFHRLHINRKFCVPVVLAILFIIYVKFTFMV